MEDDDPCRGCTAPTGDFDADGFVRVAQLVPAEFATRLNARLERLLRGEYDTGTPPDKRPKAPKGAGTLGFSGERRGQRTLQLINVWKSDKAFAALARSPTLGRVVAELAGWPSGARLAQDQVWAKPPGAPPLVFHRDSPYFDFAPADVLTVWVALDEMLPELGPLEYVRGSHRWGEGRSGSAAQFFDSDRLALVRSAAQREGIEPEEIPALVVSMAHMAAGGASIHDGRTWHGSGPNDSRNAPRRGLGLHFVPACATFAPGVELGKLWAPLKRPDSDALPDELLPVTWTPTGGAVGGGEGGGEVGGEGGGESGGEGGGEVGGEGGGDVGGTGEGGESGGEERRAEPSRAAAAPLGMPLGDHVPLEEAGVLQFVMHAEAQRLVCVLQAELLEAPYRAFGRVGAGVDGDTGAERFNLVYPSTFGSERRKPVTPRFQQWSEAAHWPLLSALLFGAGPRGWEGVAPHLTSLKVNTLRISEDEFYYGKPIYHFHLDHKIGAPAPNDANQRTTMRLIFSVVPAALATLPAARGCGGGGGGGGVVATNAPSHDSTVYLKLQPPRGFDRQEQLHEYLRRRYPERGLSAGRERPLYEVGDDELYRAKPGEVCVHRSHPGRPVHAETNPCPDGRGLYVLDWTDLRNLAPDGKLRPPTRMPIESILRLMRVLARADDADGSAAAFCARLDEVVDTARRLLASGEGGVDSSAPEPHLPEGCRGHLEAVLRAVEACRARLSQRSTA